MILYRCPNCAAQLEIDESRSVAFCQYCGTKIISMQERVTISNEQTIENLVYRALEFEQRRDFAKAEEYCQRILDLDPTNVQARMLERRLPANPSLPNVQITYRSVRGDRNMLRVTQDGRQWQTLGNEETVYLNLPVGKHKLLFSGRKSYTFDVKVQYPGENIRILFTEDKHRNTIDLI